jgi:hypothetical protein
LVEPTVEPPGKNCPAGGYRLDFGIDHDGNGVIGPGEKTGQVYVCDGVSPDGGAPPPADDGGHGADAVAPCVDTTSDPLNCGACGHACGSSDSCVVGICVDCTRLACPKPGELLFVVPQNEPPRPAVATAAFTTALQNLDVVFDVDTTGSMGGSITNLKNTIASTIVPSIAASVPSPAFGLFDFKDFGDPYVVHADMRVQTVGGLGMALLQMDLGSLSAAGGGDEPEAGWESLSCIAGQGGPVVDGYIPSPPLPPLVMGEKSGDLFGAAFRANAERVVVTVSDAQWHDAMNVLPDGNGNGLNDYTSHAGAPSRAQTLQALSVRDIKVMSLAVAGASADPHQQDVLLAQATGAVVPPSAFGSGAGRPAGCAPGQCCTGLNGVGEAPSADGTCPLVQRTMADGTGLASAVSGGVNALVAGASYDTYVIASDVDPGVTSAFLPQPSPNLTGAGAAATCLALPPDRLVEIGGSVPGISQVPAGQRVCFDVVPQMNTTVAPGAEAQFFRARLQLEGDVGVDLDGPQTVVFMVPPL